MRRSRPLADAHPELLVIDTPGLSREYRVENWHTTRNQHHGRVFNINELFSVFDVFAVVFLGLLWPSVRLACLFILSVIHHTG